MKMNQMARVLKIAKTNFEDAHGLGYS